jgi:hypothetical protein
MANIIDFFDEESRPTRVPAAFGKRAGPPVDGVALLCAHYLPSV